MTGPVVERWNGGTGGPSLLINDAAAALRVSRRTVYYRIREGRLQTIRTRCGSQRVLVSSIQELLRQDRRIRVIGGGRPSDELTGRGAGA